MNAELKISNTVDAKLNIGQQTRSPNEDCAQSVYSVTRLGPKTEEVKTKEAEAKAVTAEYVSYESPGGTSGKMTGYLVTPSPDGPHPCVILFCENGAASPHIQGIAQKLGSQGFLTLVPTQLPLSNASTGEHYGRYRFKSLYKTALGKDIVNSALFLKNHANSNGKLGAVGFRQGGAFTNFLAVQMGSKLNAAVPFYGDAPSMEEVLKIKAPILIHSAEEDARTNSCWPDFELALKVNNKKYQRFVYDGTQHGFHHESTPHYNAEAAQLAWSRTTQFFQSALA